MADFVESTAERRSHKNARKPRANEPIRPSLLALSLPSPAFIRDLKTTAVKTSVKMNLRSFKVNRAFGPAQYVKMQATFPEVEFLTTLFRFKKRKQNSSSYVPVLHKTTN